MKLLNKLLFLLILTNLLFFQFSLNSNKRLTATMMQKKLLADVKAMVDASKKETMNIIKQPGMK